MTLPWRAAAPAECGAATPGETPLPELPEPKIAPPLPPPPLRLPPDATRPNGLLRRSVLFLRKYAFLVFLPRFAKTSPQKMIKNRQRQYKLQKPPKGPLWQAWFSLSEGQNHEKIVPAHKGEHRPVVGDRQQ